MSLMQVIYASRPVDFDEATLAAILDVSRPLNDRDGITGALVCRADLYLQLLEGPQQAVDAAYGRIVRDQRHRDIKLLSRAAAEKRLFPGWAMRDDPPRTWMWTKEEVAKGAIGRATAADSVAIFERLSRDRLMASFPRAARLLGWVARKF